MTFLEIPRIAFFNYQSYMPLIGRSFLGRAIKSTTLSSSYGKKVKSRPGGIPAEPEKDAER
jgi:hypothetical protein